MMNIEKVWEKSKGDTQTIAFIDTGISDNLSDKLSERIVFKFNIFDKNDDVTDVHGHGTEIVSATCCNGEYGLYGLAQNSKIIIIKAVSDEGKTTNENLLTALRVAEKHGANIVNISIGGHKSNDAVIKQLQKMTNNNITIVAAAGDYQNKDLLFPANQPDVISVEAMSKSKKLWNQSNRSENSIFRMPGEAVEVLTIDANGNLIKEKVNGTSQATAIASGYIALIRDYYETNNISYDNKHLINILQSIETKSEHAKYDFLSPFA